MYSPVAIPAFSVRPPESSPTCPELMAKTCVEATEKAGIATPDAPTISTNGVERLAQLSREAGFTINKLNDLFSEACTMAKDGQLDYQFVFFALHGTNVYKQPTDVRDYNTLHDSCVTYHTGRPDYKMHGTIVKMPMPSMMADEAVVCHVCKGDHMVAAVASIADYDYQEIFCIM